ncbi:MAG: MFS transporter, partial [Atopobiaceae bacterium]|nr:MFS transporter [Atopobiaceae bacterium]
VNPSEVAVMGTLVLICTIARNIPALTNSVAVYYRKNGADIDYGIARGVGALADAASAALLGVLVTFTGPDSIMYTGIAFHVLLIAAFWMMPTPGESPDDPEPLLAEEEAGRSDYVGFIKGNPGFLTVVGGFALGKLMPQMLSVYGILLFKSLGGTNADLGLAVAIAQCVQLPTMMLHSTLERRFSTERVLVFAVLGCTVRAVVTSYAASLPMLILAYAFSIAEGLCAPSEVIYAEKHFSTADTNKAQGLMAMTDPLGSVFGTLLGGALVDLLGVDLFFDVLAVCTVVGLVLVLAGTRMQDRKTPVRE